MTLQKRSHQLSGFVAALLLLIGVAACSSGGTSSGAPTATLIPAPPTSTATPITPTPTLPNLPDPAAIVATATPPQATTLDGLILLARNDLTERLDLDPGIVDSVITLADTQETVLAPDICDDDAPIPQTGTRIDGYQITLVARESVYEYRSDGTDVQLCRQSDLYSGDNVAYFLEIDPVAAEMTDLARGRVARDLDLPSRRVQIISVHPRIWPDSAFGCPVEGVQVETVDVPGYEIVLAVNETTYTFRTDFQRLVQCDPDNG